MMECCGSFFLVWARHQTWDHDLVLPVSLDESCQSCKSLCFELPTAHLQVAQPGDTEPLTERCNGEEVLQTPNHGSRTRAENKTFIGGTWSSMVV